jgi:hypothetical protein
VKREVPLAITAVIGLFMMLSFFVPHQAVSVPADFLQASAIIVTAFGYLLGGANVVRLNVEAIVRRREGWAYKAVLVASLLATVAIGVAEGPGFLDPGMRSRWIYDQIYSPMAATMFALLAFFIASAAFRAFRIRTFEAGLLAAAALLVMVGRVPLTNVLAGPLLERLPDGLAAALAPVSVEEWIMNVPQNAAKRAILIGAALGVMATGLRVILGIERSYLSGEE